MNPLKKQQYDLCKLRGMKDLADKIEEIVKWINQQKPISPSGENGKPEENPLYHSQGKKCCFLNPCGCVCHQPEECPKDQKAFIRRRRILVKVHNLLFTTQNKKNKIK